jgi:hypothetical protein
MFRLILLVACALCSTTVVAQQLVDDSQKMNFVIIGEANKAPATWFDSDPSLKTFKSKVHFVVLSPASELYKQRYASIVSGPLPMVLLEHSDGRVIYAAAGSSVPRSPAAIKEELKYHINLAATSKKLDQSYSQDCPDGTCPLLPPRDESRFPLLDRDDSSPVDFTPWTKQGPVTKTANLVFLTMGIIFVLVVMLIGGVMFLAAIYFVSKLIRR